MWNCVECPQVRLKRPEPIIGDELGHSFVEPLGPTQLDPDRQPTSTAIFRCYCVVPMKALSEADRPDLSVEGSAT